eukprot:743351-Pyramimonas_sp.AAC.1
MPHGSFLPIPSAPEAHKIMGHVREFEAQSSTTSAFLDFAAKCSPTLTEDSVLSHNWCALYVVQAML